MKKLQYIDAIRGYAILGVLLVHASQFGVALKSDMGNTILLKGARGVQLFFIASAMTLFYSYYKKGGYYKFNAKDFFIRRFFRLAPMFYLAIIYNLFQKNYSGGYAINLTNLPSILSAFTFSLSLHPFWVSAIVPGGWSIGVEAIFYVILPLLFTIIDNIQKAFNLFVFAIIFRFFLQSFFLLHPMINEPNHWNSFLIYYFPNQFPVFAIGIFLYFLIFEKAKIVFSNQIIIILLLVIVLFQSVTGYDFFIPENVSFSLWLGCFTWYLSEFNSRIIVNPIINYLGKISFSLYVVHFGVLFWANHFKVLDLFTNTYINYIFKFLSVTVLSALLSSFFYFAIEKPFQRLSLKLINKKSFIFKTSTA